ncbi:hypothetical protein [Rhodopila sp.]|uniref:hypothetical protein n=1 Tax=Rhodopila sp. TaxID=2480087 RepID=UPI003D0FB936
MPHQIGSVVLGILSTFFAGYGLWELALAYRSAAFRAWTERAAIAAGSMFVAAVFAAMTVQVIDAPRSAALDQRPNPRSFADQCTGCEAATANRPIRSDL